MIFFVLYAFQIYCWKLMTGEWMLYSYSGEPGFIYWFEPKIIEILFHFENGFFMFAPFMILSIVGIFLGYKSESNHKLILLVFLGMTYLFSCWWKWSFGGAFGYRPFIDFFPMFAIPIAYVFSKIIKHWNLLGQVLSVLFVGYMAKISLTFMKKMPGHLYERPYYNWDSFLDLMERVWF
ncbi:MAG: hypothetical protein AAGK97_00465 [Bacteroidota bacterium]